MRQRHLSTKRTSFLFRSSPAKPSPQTGALIETAQAWLGFTQAAGMKTPFGERTGYDGHVWAGAFLDTIFFDAGLEIPACVYPPSGLAEFIRCGRVVTQPQPGDIVFFVFATGELFGVMHCGLVVDTSAWRETGLFYTIEACVNSGLPRSDPSLRGVYKRRRARHEVLAFCRPADKGPVGETGQPAPVITFETVRPGRRNNNIGLVQLALRQVTGLVGETPDMFDGSTQSAYAHWQRIIGYVGPDASGIPDPASLQLLGDRTRKFKLDATTRKLDDSSTQK